MASVLSESEDNFDQQSEQCGSFSITADVTESEIFDAHGASSSSQALSPLIGRPINEVEMMKERFAKLLLGEDMSGGGKGVCTALAISNAITNLAATVFGELWRLEPLALQKKIMWCREMKWLLCVIDSIVEFFPSFERFPGGGTYEVMVSRPRSDLYINLPALKQLDSMLFNILDGFRNTEFWYVDRRRILTDAKDVDSCSLSSSFGMHSVRQEDKWWLPYPRVPPNGLSEDGRKILQQCRDCTNQILKAAMAINSNVLAEMEIPDVFVETLPKSAKTCLGETIYRFINSNQFSPEYLLGCLDLSSEHKTLNIANRIEAALYFWRRKSRRKCLNRTKAGVSSWGGKVKGLVDTERSQLLAQRAKILLLGLRIQFPGLPQTALDMNKIQYNKDVGQAILESYSRVMESLAFNIMARIDDLLYVDDTTRQCAAVDSTPLFDREGLSHLPIQKQPFPIRNTLSRSPFVSPTFCSTPLVRSPIRENSSLKKNNFEGQINKISEKITCADSSERLWSYTENLSTRKYTGDTPERH